ncbi:hypothetical protein GOV05_03220 [Candidatus Woesearchaeota archaeon]|nr:hypothetical protein [Candidatus Woesearchaeota archaeon]
MKCAVCNQRIETTFLNKLLGTVIKDSKGKKKGVCSSCQKKHADKNDLLKKIK